MSNTNEHPTDRMPERIANDDTSEDVAALELDAAIHRNLGLMQENYSDWFEALRARRDETFSDQELADRFGISQEGFRGRVCKALEWLRKQLELEGFEGIQHTRKKPKANAVKDGPPSAQPTPDLPQSNRVGG